MMYLKAGLRFLGIAMLMALFIVSVFVVWCLTRDDFKQKERISRVLSFYSKLGIQVLGVNINLTAPVGNKLSRATAGRLYVSNHLSYLDILVISSLTPSLYVTSVEMRETFGLGFLARIGGCLFVERRSRLNISQEVSELRQALRNGLNVTVFPEATSTPGLEVLPFKNSLFSSVEGLAIPVAPLCLKYTNAGGIELTNEVDLQLRDLVHWYGDMKFVSHLFRLCTLGDIRVESCFLPVFNESPALSRKELAYHAYELIRTQYCQLGQQDQQAVC